MEQKVNYDEMMESLLSSDAFLAVNKKLIQLIGIEPAIFLSDLISKKRYFKEKNRLNDGWFFNTQKNRKADTGIPYHHQTKIVKMLVDIELIKVKREGLPAKQFFKINYKNLVELLSTKKEDINKSKTCLLTYKKHALELEKRLPIDYINNNNNLNNNNFTNNKIFSKEKIKESTKVDSSPTNSQNSSSYKSSSLQNKIPLQDKKGNPLQRKRNIILAQTYSSTPPDPPPQKIPKELEVWKSLELVNHRIGTKLYKDIVNAVRKLKKGTYFNSIKKMAEFHNRAFTQDEIIESIQRFSLAAVNPDYGPINNKKYLKGLSFISFLYDSFSRGGEPSQFLYYLKEEPKLCKESIKERKDEFSYITKQLIKLYCREVLGKEKTALSVSQKNKFILASRCIKDFSVENQDRFAWPMGIQECAGMLHKALIEQFNSKVSPGNYCSDYTFLEVLPKYMERMAVFRPLEKGQILNNNTASSAEKGYGKEIKAPVVDVRKRYQAMAENTERLREEQERKQEIDDIGVPF